MVGFRAGGTNGKREVNEMGVGVGGGESQMRRIRWREVGREPGDRARTIGIAEASGGIRRHQKRILQVSRG